MLSQCSIITLCPVPVMDLYIMLVLSPMFPHPGRVLAGPLVSCASRLRAHLSSFVAAQQEALEAAAAKHSAGGSESMTRRRKLSSES